jgi:hypothetical protein
MFSLLLVSLLVGGGFEAGGRIGVVLPASGLEKDHSAAALFGASLGYEVGPSRLMLEYGYSGLQARQASSYRLDIHELSAGYAHEFAMNRPPAGSIRSWGFEASAAAGFGLLGRALGSARETGRTPCGHVGAALYQRQGHSRFSLGLDNIVYVESQPNGSARTVSLAYLIALKGGVSYVF